MLDLLTEPVLASPGAVRRDGQIVVSEAWAPLGFRPRSLRAGWYMFSVDPDCTGLCLQLTEVVRHIRIELSARAGNPAYVWLAAGTYAPALFAGVRPGSYPVAKARLQSMPTSGRLKLFTGRFFEAVRGGLGPRAILGLIRKAVAPRASHGVRPPGTGASPLGVLTGADSRRAWQDRPSEPVTDDGPRFHVRLATGPLTADQLLSAGLSAQTHQAFSVDPAGCDAELVLGADEVLTPDAVARFAELFRHDAKLSVAIADKWIDGVPTLRPAFDPLLYANNVYPTPHARRLPATGPSPAWHQDKRRFAVLPMPLATGQADGPFAPPRPLPLIRPTASVIIPTRDRADLLRACLGGLFEATDWPHEVIVVDNGSIEPDTFAVFDIYAAKGLRVIRADMPFNFSTLCNLGAKAATGEALVFMNNDIVLTGANWLGYMMALAVDANIGAVGARLLYADKRLQHGGVALGLTQLCGHLWRGLPYDRQNTIPSLTHDSLRSAVTAALLCVMRHKFDAVGGFDEQAFPVTLNDIDLCLRLQARGWFSAYAAGAEAYHLEGESRGEDLSPEKQQRRKAEMDVFDKRWHDLIDADPWLPVAVARSTEAFMFR